MAGQPRSRATPPQAVLPPQPTRLHSVPPISALGSTPPRHGSPPRFKRLQKGKWRAGKSPPYDNTLYAPDHMAGEVAESDAEADIIELPLDLQVVRLSNRVEALEETVRRYEERINDLGKILDISFSELEAKERENNKLQDDILVIKEYLGLADFQHVQVFNGLQPELVQDVRGLPRANSTSSAPVSALSQTMPPPPSATASAPQEEHMPPPPSATETQHPPVQLIPPTPQTSQEAAHYSTVTLVPGSTATLHNVDVPEPEADPKADDEADPETDEHVEADIQVPDAPDDQVSGSEAIAETAIGVGFTGLPSTAYLAPPSPRISPPPLQPQDLPSRARLSPGAPEELRRSPRGHSHSPGPSRRVTPAPRSASAAASPSASTPPPAAPSALPFTSDSDRPSLLSPAPPEQLRRSPRITSAPASASATPSPRPTTKRPQSDDFEQGGLKKKTKPN